MTQMNQEKAFKNKQQHGELENNFANGYFIKEQHSPLPTTKVL